MKILPQILHIDRSEGPKAAIRPVLYQVLQSVREPKRGSVRINPLPSQASAALELIPAGTGYEVSFPAANLIGPMGLTLTVPEDASGTGNMGLFLRADDSQWTFLKAVGSQPKVQVGMRVPGMYSLLRDILPPRLALKEGVDLSEPFHSAQPIIHGLVVEEGAGLEPGSLEASVDNGPGQPIPTGADGSFAFKPMGRLTGGTHDIVFSARDQVGNVGFSERFQIQVVVPLEIEQIIQYPNPARTRTQIRISANRRDLNEDLVEVKIYDVAGHKVRTLSGVRPVREQWGVFDRFLYDIRWDLTNEDGRAVANGVYLAKITVQDPDNPDQKTRRTHKLAVLR